MNKTGTPDVEGEDVGVRSLTVRIHGRLEEHLQRFFFLKRRTSL